MFCGLSINSMTKLMPKPVSSAYIKSLTVAPTPVTKPNQRPLFKVRCTQSTPTGPIGAEQMMPTIIPLTMMSRKLKVRLKVIYGIMDAKLQK